MLGSPDQTDLEEVINLLSCVPVSQFSSKLRNKNVISYPINKEQLNNMIPKEALSSLTEQLQNQPTWPNKDDGIKTDSLYWRLNDCSSGLTINSGIHRSHTYKPPELFNQWECKEIQMYVCNFSFILKFYMFSFMGLYAIILYTFKYERTTVFCIHNIFY